MVSMASDFFVARGVTSIKFNLDDRTMATRIPLSWIVLLLCVSVFAFFGYHILQASTPVSAPFQDMPYPEIAKALPQPQQEPRLVQEEEQDDVGAPVVQKQNPIPNRMPAVPAQTEEDLRAAQPHMATPPATQYDAPDATDPLNPTVYMGAEFGSNLRHPEQMIEMRPGLGMGSVVPSGLGSEHSSPGGNRAAGYAPEMAQNGGEFMQGINAFDVSEYGAGYSMF
jgi:hypothetical protein